MSPRTLRRWFALCSVLVGCALILSPAGSANAAPAGAMLPDLRLIPPGCRPGDAPGRPCNDWDVCLVADAGAPNGTCLSHGPAQAVRLRFTSGAENAGDGPLLLYGSRNSMETPAMQIRQAFQIGVNGPIPKAFDEAQQPIAGTLFYEPAASHMHWHFADFQHFELRGPGLVVTDRKNGFCLGDRYNTADVKQLPNAVRPHDGSTPQGRLAKDLSSGYCRMHQPDVLDVMEGISVGRGDDYSYRVDFQWLDITRVPSGRYELVSFVNPRRTLVESNYANNVSSTAIDLRWPGGALYAPNVITEEPEVTVVATCPGVPRCG